MKKESIRKPLFLTMSILSFLVFAGFIVIYFYDFSYFKNLTNGLSILDLPNLLLAISCLISLMGIIGMIIGYSCKDRWTILVSSIVLSLCFLVGGSYKYLDLLVAGEGFNFSSLNNIYLLSSSACLILFVINVITYMSCFKAKKHPITIILFSIFAIVTSIGSIVLYLLGTEAFSNISAYFDFASILNNELSLCLMLVGSLLFSVGSITLYKKLY